MATPDARTPESPAERRRLRQREDARRAILDATEALVLEDGESFSIRRLADRCGYTAPTIYHYFGDKSGLVDALLEERYAGLLRQGRRARQPGEPTETLRAVARIFVRFGLRHPSHTRLMQLRRPETAAPIESAEGVRALLDEPLAELARAGRLVDSNVEEAVQSLWALLHGIVGLQTNRPDYAWSKTLIDASIDALLRGLVRPTGPNGDPR